MAEPTPFNSNVDSVMALVEQKEEPFCRDKKLSHSGNTRTCQGRPFLIVPHLNPNLTPSVGAVLLHGSYHPNERNAQHSTCSKKQNEQK